MVTTYGEIIRIKTEEVSEEPEYYGYHSPLTAVAQKNLSGNWRALYASHEALEVKAAGALGLNLEDTVKVVQAITSVPDDPVSLELRSKILEELQASQVMRTVDSL